MADRHPAELDPAHILAVCGYATGGRHNLAVGAATGICVCLPSRRDARGSASALARVGYQVAGTASGHGRDLLVTGWDNARLDTRLAAQRSVMYQLDGDPVMTARAALTGRNAGQPSAAGAPEFMNWVRGDLHRWVFTRCGVHASRDPAIVPADLGAAFRLGASVRLEQVIEDLIARQLRVARHASALYGSLLPRFGPAAARDAAIRWASITFHLTPPPGQHSTSLAGAVPAVHEPRPAPGAPPGTRPGIRDATPPPLRLPARGGLTSPSNGRPGGRSGRILPESRPRRAR